MLRKYPILKWSLISLGSLIVVLVAFGFWFFSLLPQKEMRKNIKASKVESIPYIANQTAPYRGKILVVVTSCDTMGSSGKSTGYELTELSRAYYVFQANGFEVDIASPLGGEPPVVIDGDDMGAFDYAFLNDPTAQFKASHTLAMNKVNGEDYRAVYFAGGKGAMYDFPNNAPIQALLRNFYHSNKVIGAVCHGPAALVNVKLNDGSYLVQNKRVSSFTNKEELLLIPDAITIFPFLLQDELTAHGANFNEGALYLENVCRDGNLITGQNPWSTWKLAESMIEQLGYTPKHRPVTGEENAVSVLKVYEQSGAIEAKAEIKRFLVEEKQPVDRVLILSHSVMAAINGELGRFFGLIALTSYTKDQIEALTK